MIIELNKLIDQNIRISRFIYMSGDRHPLQGVNYSEPVEIDVSLQSKDREFKLSGRFSTSLLLSCHRCLSAFQYPVQQDLDLVFIPKDKMPDEVDVELADEEMNIAFYQDFIDLCQIIDEQIALALPMKFLCSPDCKGLCQQCGMNLNRGSCNCHDDRIDERLLVLREIKEKLFGKKS